MATRPADPPRESSDRYEGAVEKREVPFAVPWAAVPGHGEHEISIRDYWRVLLKRRWIVVGVAVAAVVGTLIYSLLDTPLYRASATIQIDSSPLRVIKTEGIETIDSSNDFMGTQLELLLSRALAERTVRQLALVGNQAFEAAVPQHGGLAALRSMLSGKQVAQDQRPLEQREAQAVDRVIRDLSAQLVRGSRLIKVSFVSPDPAVARQVTNGIVQNFLQSNLDRRVDNSQFARAFLEDRLQQIKVKLEESERALIAYLQKQQMINLDQFAALEAANLSHISSALATAQTDRMKAEARAQLADALSGASLEALKSPVLDALRQKHVELKAEFEAKRSIYKPEYPEMAQLARRITELEGQIAEATRAYQRAVRAEFEAARINEALLRGQMDTLRKETLDLQSRGIQYNILKRESDTNRQLYDALLQRYKEIGVSGDVGASNVSIVDTALDGTRFKPDFSKNLSLGLLLGLLFAIALALLMEKLDDTLKTPQEVERLLGVPVVGIVPKVPPEMFDAVIADPKSGFSEAYRSLRAALQFATDEGCPKVLLVTSAVAAEGKSTSAIMLARKFAQLGLRVLLVDADLRKPTLHRRFGLSNDVGLSAYLAGQTEAPEIFTPSGEENLDVVTSGRLPPNPSELLGGPRYKSLLTLAASRYDQIIVDSPPLLGLADVPVLANAADGTLVVIEAAETRVGVARATLKRLAAVRAPITGALLVKFDSRETGYGYDYGYGYADEYHYYAYYGGERKRGRPRGKQL